MVYCLQARLAFSTAARRNNVRTSILNRVASRQRWGVEEVLAIDTRPRIAGGQNGLAVDNLRFVSRADVDDLKALLDSLWAANPPLVGSWIQVHDCSHDEGRDVCAVTFRRDW